MVGSDRGEGVLYLRKPEKVSLRRAGALNRGMACKKALREEHIWTFQESKRMWKV